MKKINIIVPSLPVIPTRKKVAAYARISEEKGRTMHSLAAQVSFYSEFIQQHSEWEYAGVYADGGLSGTSTDRAEFRRMLADCEAGKIDIILTKSISRFARNTVDLLETVRHLREKGIEVRFEKEHINSLSEDGELMLTLLASFAQEESRSTSENIKWAIKKKFEQGRPNSFCMYGYRWNGENFVVEPREAEIVRLIYDNFLNGISAEQTEKQLEEMGVKSYTGQHFSNTSIRAILRNEKYTGNMLLQKEFTVSHITHKSKKNEGELPQYWVENSHEAIISLETFQAVQAEIKRRRALGALANPHIPTSCFTGKLKCSNCGRSYRRRTYKRQNDSFTAWCCRSKDEKGRAFCDATNVPHPALIESCCMVLGTDSFDEAFFIERVESITVLPEHTLVFHMSDGDDVPYTWQYRCTGKKDCWTDERRIAWGLQHRGQNNNRVKNPFTGLLHCPSCGGNFRRQSHRYADGTDATYWHCGNDRVCSNKCKVPETFLKAMIRDVLGLPEFDEAVFKERVSSIEVSGDAERQAVFHLADGSTMLWKWSKPKKRGVKHTEEWKQNMRAFWSKRRRDEECQRQGQ